MACAFDSECPQTQWCYKYFGNSTPAFCDCPSYYGFIDKSSNCTSYSFHTYLWIVPTVINSLVLVGILLYYLWHADVHRLLCVRSRVKVSPAIKIWISGLIAYASMLVSFGIRLWDIFHPQDWDVLRDIRRDFAKPKEKLKVSEVLQVYFLFFMGYVVFFVIAIIETILLWLELTQTAKKLTSARFRYARIAALVFEVVIMIIVITSVVLSEFASLILLWWVGLPVLLGLLALITYARITMLSILKPSIKGEAEEGGRRTSIATESGKFRDFADRVRKVSSAMLIALVLAIIPFFLIWLAVINDWRTVRPGELGFFVFALQLFDIIFILSAGRIFNYTAAAVRKLARKASLRGVESKNSKEQNRKKGGAAKDDELQFTPKVETPTLDRLEAGDELTQGKVSQTEISF